MPSLPARARVKVEKGRDGVQNTNLLSTGKFVVDERTYYGVEYTSESTRGFNHVLSRIAVADGRLYVFEVKVKEADFPEVRPEAEEILGSFRVVGV